MERERGIIERGKITDVSENGYSIASYDRDGIITPPIRQVEWGKSSDQMPQYEVGDEVYYFIFHDGTGRIICAI